MLQGIHLQGQIFQVYFPFLGVRIVTIHAVGIKQIKMLSRHDGFWLISKNADDGHSNKGQQGDFVRPHA